MTNEEMLKMAKEVVFDHIIENTTVTDEHIIDFSMNDVFIVWFCKTLQNWKALVSTTISDGKYYEITFNGDKGEIYMDVYKKQKNICLKKVN